MALIRHERIITTLEKAKELRPFVERLITLAKKGTLHHRRLALSRLGPMAKAEVKPGSGDDADHRTVLTKLFSDLGPRYADRPGGYTRVIKRHERRLGDGGKTAFIELLKEGETKHRLQPAPAPAPEPETEEPAPEEAVAEQPQEQPQEQPAAEQQPAPEGQPAEQPKAETPVENKSANP
jgi:large subunit ribosomal protein L17